MSVITRFDWSVRGQYFSVLPARYCPLLLQILGSGNNIYVHTYVCVCVYIYIYDVIAEQNWHKKLPRCNITAWFWLDIDSIHQCSPQDFLKE